MRYRKKPVVIEAVPVGMLIRGMVAAWGDLPDWVKAAYEQGVICAVQNSGLTVKTSEGDMIARPRDMLIRGVKGEIYPCKPDIFAATYELVDEP